ncbi:N-acetylneuraminate synthase family protein [Synechococcus sp. MIT S9452]|uniref:N-acetylneuraminate synthase family protein n=1 Tax=Synechococcus sp. MIT S9452 TaxID=3082546 RepID=UPI0039A47E50
MLRPRTKIQVGGREIGETEPTYFIADIAANHDGDLSRAKDLIYRAAEAGADAAKFQHFQADTIVSDKGFKQLKTTSSHQTNWKGSVYDVYKSASVDLSWTKELKSTCDDVGIPFFTTPYSLDIVDFIDEYVPAYKIGSGDLTWLQLIQHVAGKHKPYMIATGASSMDEVHRAVTAALTINPQLALMQCNTNYTASLDNFKFIQLNVLRSYRAMYPDMILGLSDHTPGHSTVLGAVTLGARIIEKHFTDDNERIGPDHAFSMDPNSWREMVDRTRELEQALGNGIKQVEDNEKETVILQRRALRLNNTMQAGEVIKDTHLEILRPCPTDAIPPYLINQVIGKKLTKQIEKGEYIRFLDIQ